MFSKKGIDFYENVFFSLFLGEFLYPDRAGKMTTADLFFVNILYSVRFVSFFFLILYCLIDE